MVYVRILFTGASSFTGMWFATALARRGHSVVAAIRREERAYAGLRCERVARAAQCCQLVWNAPFGSNRFLDSIAQEGPFAPLLIQVARAREVEPVYEETTGM